MAKGIFVIKEQARANGELFTWTADTVATDGSQGGARAAPQGSWAIQAAQRTTRTDYPGSMDGPTEHVLGLIYQPQTFTGEFFDKWNEPGYAVNEMRRFEEMVGRGNLVWISFQDQIFTGLITAAKFDYRTKDEIGYEFTFSPHKRNDGFKAPERPQPKSQKEVGDAVKLAKAELDKIPKPKETTLNQNEATVAINGRGAIGGFLSDLQAKIDDLNSMIENRSIPGASQAEYFKRTSLQLRSVAGSAFTIITSMAALRSDIDVGIQSAMAVWDFEAWARSSRFQYRLLMGKSNSGAVDMEERAQPRALRIYRPFKGESLYNVSQKFYGTPHGWRVIADRNNIRTTELTGDEKLIIPEREGG